MTEVIWKLTGEWPYFLSNILIGVRVVSLLDCPFVLSLLKHRSVGVFLNKKNEDPKHDEKLMRDATSTIFSQQITCG